MLNQNGKCHLPWNQGCVFILLEELRWRKFLTRHAKIVDGCDDDGNSVRPNCGSYGNSIQIQKHDARNKFRLSHMRLNSRARQVPSPGFLELFRWKMRNTISIAFILQDCLVSKFVSRTPSRT